MYTVRILHIATAHSSRIMSAHSASLLWQNQDFLSTQLT